MITISKSAGSKLPDRTILIGHPSGKRSARRRRSALKGKPIGQSGPERFLPIGHWSCIWRQNRAIGQAKTRLPQRLILGRRLVPAPAQALSSQYERSSVHSRRLALAGLFPAAAKLGSDAVQTSVVWIAVEVEAWEPEPIAARGALGSTIRSTRMIDGCRFDQAIE
jgi:hypothetical protein